ncbi:hypothetical protein DID88_007014 [Monilinia fructigena]|uniref:RNA helicase n=1 Tax=Monilinia fructigena TaxID=38457 RepID=A0A395J9H1_9HELO|nr:hypothetical protein DID88_007014 [Monilinia fructigena]
MASWNIDAMANALPNVTATSVATANAEQHMTPQEAGWVPTTKYDYDTYNMSAKELSDARDAGAEAAADADDEPETLAVGGVRPGDWASNGAIYEWDEEFGDVGPRYPALEEQFVRQAEQPCSSSVVSLSVTQEGATKIVPVRRFEDAGLHPVMLENVKLAGYRIPTPIQQYCLPAVKTGYDVVACAQTGSGKTAAFLIPILSKLMGKAKKLAAPRPNPATFVPTRDNYVRAEPLVVIVCPSRELATQIFDEARRFCYRTMLRPCVVYGGGPLAEQLNQLAKGCDLLIGTPGRLCDMIRRPQALTLKRLRYMVIDEADEMLNTSWEDELKQIMTGGGKSRRGQHRLHDVLCHLPKMARDIAREHLSHDHVRIRVGRAGSSHFNIKQDVIYVEAFSKKKALKDLLLSTPPARTMIFVNTKRAADEVDDFLFNEHLPCTSIHAGRTQREREDSIRAFRNGKTPIMIATGVSSRGLDVHNVMHVINFDLPSNAHGGIDEYTHRIGRTGRIGNMGLASSFYNTRNEDIAEALAYLPEGFTMDGQTGDIDTLQFDDDSDGEEEGGENTEGDANAGVAWGADVAAAGWGPDETTQAAPAVGRDWVATGTTQAAPAVSGWGVDAGGSGWA